MSPILSRLSSPYGFAFYAGASGPTPPSGLGAVYGGGFYIGILSGAWWIVSDSDTEIGGGFITDIDIYFGAKDTTLPAWVEVRNVINGYPGPKVLPFGRKVLEKVD